MNTSNKCRNCFFWQYDMDGEYCGHDDSMREANPFGQGLTLARSAEGVCKPEGVLYKPTKVRKLV